MCRCRRTLDGPHEGFWWMSAENWTFWDAQHSGVFYWFWGVFLNPADFFLSSFADPLSTNQQDRAGQCSIWGPTHVSPRSDKN